MHLQLGHAVLLIFAAAAAGAMNALAGGGSFIAFPALLFTGVPPIPANATNTIALWPGLASSAVAYWKRLTAPLRVLLPLLVTSIIGGWVGALLLLKTPQHTFLRLIPWLLLSGTLLFTFGNSLRALAGKSAVVDDLSQISVRAIALSSCVQFLIAIYGGYFGAGLGFVILAMLAMMGMNDIHAMGALRTLMAAAVNASAVVTFIVAGAVFWPQGIVMIIGSSAGGWFGAHYAQRTDPRKVRILVICIGFAMSLYFFITVR
jgi:uncharacterized membrane protein YfcA